MSIWSRIKGLLWEAPVKAPARRNIFAGARVSPLTADWGAGIHSPNQELQWSARMLRARSRDLERNNPLARRFFTLMADNVIGHCGVRLQARVPTVESEGTKKPQLHRDNGKIEAAWERWGKPRYASADRRLSWQAIQHLAVRTMVRDGECFIRTVPGFDNPFGYAIQILDADQFDDQYEQAADNRGRPRIVQGVELDQWGGAVAYYMWTHHPGDYGVEKKRTRVPASELIHLYIPRRAGQVRGEPWLAPVMVPLKMLDGYVEAELVAARTASAKMGFIQQGEDAIGPDPNVPAADSSPRELMEAAPGVIDRLGIGETFVGWDPQHPMAGFGPFVDTIAHLIAAGGNVAHASLTGNLSLVNYSSMKVGQQPERDHWRVIQAHIVDHLCDPVYSEWLRWASLTPELRISAADLRRFEQVRWQPRGWPSPDPQKDVAANAAAVAFGFTSPQRVIGEDGADHEEVLKEIAEFNTMAESLGVTIATPNTATVPIEEHIIGHQNAPDSAMPTGGAAMSGGAGGRAMNAPRYSIGDRVIATVNHMEGMAGMAGAIAEARAGDPPYYAVNFDEPMETGNPHKWLAENEIEAESPSPSTMKNGNGNGHARRVPARLVPIT